MPSDVAALCPKSDWNVNGTVRARDFRLAADLGSITVTGTVDASGRTGGRITLAAGGARHLFARQIT